MIRAFLVEPIIFRAPLLELMDFLTSFSIHHTNLEIFQKSCHTLLKALFSVENLPGLINSLTLHTLLYPIYFHPSTSYPYIMSCPEIIFSSVENNFRYNILFKINKSINKTRLFYFGFSRWKNTCWNENLILKH